MDLAVGGVNWTDMAAEVTVRVRWLMWAVAREITSRRLRTSMSAVVAISLDPVEILLA